MSDIRSLFTAPRVADYVEVPPEAPKPRIWKSLGHCMPGMEMHYGLERFDGDLDVDRESELKFELAGVATTLANNDAMWDGLCLQREKPFWRPAAVIGMRVVAQQVLVRFVSCQCGSGLYTTRN